MKIEGTIEFDENDLVYEEHFPDHPIVPGCLAISFFLSQVGREAIGEKFKFIRFMKPGIEYNYSISFDGSRAMCKFFDHESTFVSGVLKCK